MVEVTRDSIEPHNLNERFVDTFTDAVAGVMYCNAWRKDKLKRLDPAGVRLDTRACILVENLEVSAFFLEPTQAEIQEERARKNLKVAKQSTKSLAGELGDTVPQILGRDLTRVGGSTLQRVADKAEGVQLKKYTAERIRGRITRLRQRVEREPTLRAKLDILLSQTHKLKRELRKRYKEYFENLLEVGINYAGSTLVLRQGNAGDLNFLATQLGDINKAINSFTAFMAKEKVVRFVLKGENFRAYLDALSELLTTDLTWKVIDPVRNKLVTAKRGENCRQ